MKQIAIFVLIFSGIYTVALLLFSSHYGFVNGLGLAAFTEAFCVVVFGPRLTAAISRIK